MPPTPRAALIHFAQGLLMGGADIIPGVSGGTMALIVGIYERLIDALSHLFSAVGDLLRFNGAKARDHLRATEWLLIVPLGLGIATAILVASTFIPYLLEHYPARMLGLFFGLILGSLALPWLRIGRVTARLAGIALAAAAATFFLVGLPAAGEATDPALWRIFLSAAVAICAMILPGISGAFLLLVLGLYEPTLEALSRFDLLYVGVFLAGIAVGLGLFSQVLHWLLDHHHDPTMAALVGLMAGSLRAIWPWQRAGHALDLHLPGPADPLWSVVGLILAGFAFVSALTWYSVSSKRQTDAPKDGGRREPAPDSDPGADRSL